MHTTLLLPLLAALVGTSCLRPAQPAPILLRPGQNIQEIVEEAPAGTTFRLESGIYRGQTIRPKDRQRFIGQDRVVLNGAVQLRAWTSWSPSWASEALPPALPSHGKCDARRPLCSLREDLFVNDQLYWRVASHKELGPGTWYREADRAYLADDPTGRSVELGITPLAFVGEAENVVLERLIVEKYASDAQTGAIDGDDARGWLLSDVIARWNYGAGLSFGPRTRVVGGSFSHNGQLGMAGSGEGSSIQGATIAFNNYAGYDPVWEAGGSKFWETTGLVVRESCIHGNDGPGLWSDKDNIDTLYENNRIFSNANEGIKHEISCRAIIRNNVVADNGSSYFDQWLWGSQISPAEQQRAHVHNNLVQVSAAFGNGIGVIHQDRGHGDYGRWDAANNRIVDNMIVHLGSHDQSGIVSDTGDDWIRIAGGNRFDENVYVVPSPRVEYWTARGRDEYWPDLREHGFELNGKMLVEQRASLRLACDR